MIKKIIDKIVKKHKKLKSSKQRLKDRFVDNPNNPDFRIGK